MEYPKNILQPFVENSILHGILLHRDQNKKLIPGKIRITVELERDRVVTTVEDNGTGMDEADLKKYFEELPDQKILAETKKKRIGFSQPCGNLQYPQTAQLSVWGRFLYPGRKPGRRRA